ncbi:MAG: phage terminase large subunit [Patescibacteria group bacterium]|nr:phage terminase large subunit [Patescibacteria group bacterium]MDE2015053.1 phage terminase large subunit [Patescibacteria group bacterium]MDE2226481.1 phage terminase large subunit [Patescibacteria group bacterium]
MNLLPAPSNNADKFNFFIDVIRKSRLLRRKLGQWSHPLFFNIYLADYLKDPMGQFHKEMFALTEANASDLCIVAGFRNSGKSAIFNTSLSLWSILSGRAHFITIISETLHQSKQHFSNIRMALASPLLRNDFGPIDMDGDERTALGMTFKKFDARIVALSSEQAVRGLRYRHYRPDLIICDDLENLQNTRVKESRDQTYEFFNSEIIPLGTPETKVYVLGNFLNEYSLLGRLKEQIVKGDRRGVFRRFPLVDDEGVCQWPEKFPTAESLDAFKKKIGDEATWEREYGLRIIANEDRLVFPDWFQRWSELPAKEILKVVIACDPAISTKSSADYTGIAVGLFAGHGDAFRAYIIETVNRRMNSEDVVNALKALYEKYAALYGAVELRIEKVQYQQMLIERLAAMGLPVIGVPATTDKRARLSTVAGLIRIGRILFPQKPRTETLEQQLVGFGVERYDDQVDAFTILAHATIGQDVQFAGMWTLDLDTGEIETVCGDKNRSSKPAESYSVDPIDLLDNASAQGFGSRPTSSPPLPEPKVDQT